MVDQGERQGGSGRRSRRTAEEQSVIDVVARSRGKEWAEEHAELLLEQARMIGNIAPQETTTPGGDVTQ